jgi:hypothetical protein
MQNYRQQTHWLCQFSHRLVLIMTLLQKKKSDLGWNITVIEEDKKYA